MRYTPTFLGLWLWLAPNAVQAQATSTDQTELIRALLTRVEQLEKRVAELEGRPNPAGPARQPGAASVEPAPAALPPVTPPPSEAAAAPNPVATPPQVLSDRLAEHPGMLNMMGPAMHIAGFSDFDFSATNQPGSHSGFNEGQFVLQINSALSSKVSFFSELSLTARTDAGSGKPPAAGFNIEVERAIIKFEQNDYFKISFGRYHTPINYWNMTFHHGQWLQTTISRPQMVEFGGAFLPIHFVGALVEGAVPADGLNLNYNFGIGNGRSSDIARSGDFGDVNNNRAWLTGFFIRPDFLYGLQVGGSVYRDLVTPLGGGAWREWIQSGHVVWHKENPEVIAEFSNVTHQEVGSLLQSNSQAWYAQVGYRLPGVAHLWKPYYRFEYIHVPGSDALFRSLVPSFSGSTVGIRYDISSFAAMKLEYRNMREPGEPRVIGAFAQTSFTF